MMKILGLIFVAAVAVVVGWLLLRGLLAAAGCVLRLFLGLLLLALLGATWTMLSFLVTGGAGW
jgi:glucan phosphoethanolaminetransferase (alkaline phosphatase superfamily)